jgi:hypothetical protein
MDGALRELRAVRYRAHGRRAADRAQGHFQRRKSDVERSPAMAQSGMDRVLHALAAQRNLVIVAAGAGVAFGVISLLLVLLALRR